MRAIGLIGVLALMGQSCDSREPAQTPPLRSGYLAVPIWEVRIGPEASVPTARASLGAGNGVVAYYLHDPCRHGMLVLQEPAGGDGGPCPDPSDPSTFGSPVRDVVFAGKNGDVWWLGLPKGSLIAHGNEGNRVVTRLPSRGTVLAACSSDGQLIVYADSAVPGRLQFHDLRQPDSAWTRELPAEFQAPDQGPWHAVQLGGAPGFPCVLVAPRAATFVVVHGDTALQAVPFHEPPPPAPRRSWWQRLGIGPEPAPPAPGPLDATSFAGGVAVLYQGTTADGGRLVDLYDPAGKYQRTLILPHAAIRIASTGTQLVALSHRDRRWHLALYWFPGNAAGAVPAESLRVQRPPAETAIRPNPPPRE